MKKTGKIILIIIISLIGLAMVKMWEAESGNNLTWILAIFIIVFANILFKKNKETD